MFSHLSLDCLYKVEKELTDKARNAPRSKPEAPSNAWTRFSYELGEVRAEIKRKINERTDI